MTKSMNETTSQPPESIVLAKRLWMWVVLVEAVHQILRAVAQLLDPAEIKQQAREQNPQVSEALLDAASKGAIILALLISVALLGLVAWAAATFKRQLLLFVGIYLAIRVPTVFMEPKPGWLFAVDGVAQIIVGVLAVLAIVMGARKDSVEWTSK